MSEQPRSDNPHYWTIMLRQPACTCGWTGEPTTGNTYAAWGEHAKQAHGYVAVPVAEVFRPATPDPRTLGDTE